MSNPRIFYGPDEEEKFVLVVGTKVTDTQKAILIHRYHDVDFWFPKSISFEHSESGFEDVRRTWHAYGVPIWKYEDAEIRERNVYERRFDTGKPMTYNEYLPEGADLSMASNPRGEDVLCHIYQALSPYDEAWAVTKGAVLDGGARLEQVRPGANPKNMETTFTVPTVDGADEVVDNIVGRLDELGAVKEKTVSESEGRVVVSTTLSGIRL